MSVIYTDNGIVSCQGGDNDAEHPLIYLNLEKNIKIQCPYCSQNFCFKKSLKSMKYLS